MIEHVGSTAVEGMAAKTVLDIDIVVRSLDMLPRIVARLGSHNHLGTAAAGRPRHRL